MSSSSKKARNHFLGKQGFCRLNCAQSVLSAFGVDEKKLYDFQSYGGGKAPGGWCGAASAASFLLKDKQFVENAFRGKAGAITCKEIRRLRKLSCVECVELAADLVKENLPHIG